MPYPLNLSLSLSFFFSQAQQGELAAIAKLADPSYAVEVSSPVPDVSLVSFVSPGVLLVKIDCLALSYGQLRIIYHRMTW